MTENLKMFETQIEEATKQWDYHESMKYCANLSLIFSEVSAVLRNLLSHCIGRSSGCTGGSLWTSENVFVVRTTKHWLRLPREVVESLEMGKRHLERVLAALGGSALMSCRGPVQPLNSQRGVETVTALSKLLFPSPCSLAQVSHPARAMSRACSVMRMDSTDLPS